MTTTNVQDLSSQIEQVVQAHIAASHRAASAAVERAFVTAAGAPSRPPRSSRSGKTSPRRSRADIAALGEQLYRVVCAKPGEAMAVFAAEIGVSPRDLERPMTQLRRVGRVRSVGQRHLTRYFPLVSEGTESA